MDKKKEISPATIALMREVESGRMDEKKKAAAIKKLNKIKLKITDPLAWGPIDALIYAVKSGGIGIEAPIMSYLEAGFNDGKDKTIEESMQQLHNRLKIKKSDLQTSLERVHKFMDRAYDFPPDWKHFWRFVSEKLSYDEFDELLVISNPEKYFKMYGEYFNEHYSGLFKRKEVDDSQKYIIDSTIVNKLFDKYKKQFPDEDEISWRKRFSINRDLQLPPININPRIKTGSENNRLLIITIIYLIDEYLYKTYSAPDKFNQLIKNHFGIDYQTLKHRYPKNGILHSEATTIQKIINLTEQLSGN